MEEENDKKMNSRSDLRDVCVMGFIGTKGIE